VSDKVRTLSPPKTLRFCQELNTLALAQKRDRELLLWTLLRALNDTGSGQLDLPPATDFLIKLGYSRRTLYRHLSHGEGVFWHRYSKGLTRRINLYGVCKVCLHFKVQINKRSKWVELEATELPKLDSVLQCRALLWNAGAYQPCENLGTGIGTDRLRHPISRNALEVKTGVPERRQQRYDTVTHARRLEVKVVGRRSGPTMCKPAVKESQLGRC
jgi:hypothetical protein